MEIFRIISDLRLTAVRGSLIRAGSSARNVVDSEVLAHERLSRCNGKSLNVIDTYLGLANRWLRPPHLSPPQPERMR